MPEIRINPSRVPHATGIPNTKPAQNYNNGATVGSHISAAPSSGHAGQQQVQAARATLGGGAHVSVSPPPGQARATPSGQARPAPVRPQAAMVQAAQPRQNMGVIRAGGGGGGVGGYQNAKPTVEIIQRNAPLPSRVSQSPFSLDEILLLGNVLHAEQLRPPNEHDNPESTMIKHELTNSILIKLSSMMDQIPSAAVPAPPSPIQPQAMPHQAMPGVQPPAYASMAGYGMPTQVPYGQAQWYGPEGGAVQPPAPAQPSAGGAAQPNLHQMFGATIIGDAPSVQVVPATGAPPANSAPKAG